MKQINIKKNNKIVKNLADFYYNNKKNNNELYVITNEILYKVLGFENFGNKKMVKVNAIFWYNLNKNANNYLNGFQIKNCKTFFSKD